jgi:hypothetical protein
VHRRSNEHGVPGGQVIERFGAHGPDRYRTDVRSPRGVGKYYGA